MSKYVIDGDEPLDFESYDEAITRAEQTSVDAVRKSDDFVMYSPNDDKELITYEKYTYEDWKTAVKGHHSARDSPSVYFDIDGTLGYWYKDGRGLPLEEILNPKNHYFRDIEPHPMMIELAKALHNSGTDVCIISAADRDTFRDKWEWINKHLPFIPKENICFAPLGVDKSKFVKGNAAHSILIDDYNVNLDKWCGKAIKAINFVNSHQLKYQEIDFTKSEQLLRDNPTWTTKDFKKEIIAARDFVLEEIKVQQNAIRFAKEVDDALAGKMNQFNNLKVCETPQILLNVGCRQLPMLYTQHHLKDALHMKSASNSHWHGLTTEQMKKIPELLQDPTMIFDTLSTKNSNSIGIILNAMDNDNAPLLVSIMPNGNGIYELEAVESNFITSIYGKDSSFSRFVERIIESDKMLFFNKEKSQELFSSLQLQLPQALNNLDSNIIIHQSRNIVKGFPQKISEISVGLPEFRKENGKWQAKAVYNGKKEWTSIINSDDKLCIRLDDGKRYFFNEKQAKKFKEFFLSESKKANKDVDAQRLLGESFSFFKGLGKK
ncbi:MAG: hypothetical protein LUI06_04855 [Ruminococcus sp.]|nr:hypothetical protein [Ruminococcus sp.]